MLLMEFVLWMALFYESLIATHFSDERNQKIFSGIK